MTTPLPSSFTRRDFIRGASLTAAALSLPRFAWAADAPPAKKLGVAIAGLGGYATGQILPAIKESKFCKLTGVVTRDPNGKGKKWAADNGFPEKSVYSLETMHQMADNPDIDAVYVITPNGLHAEYAILAAMAGKHVISEKPMANSVVECDAMIMACQAMNRKLALGYRMHYDSYANEMIRLSKDPNFGPFTKIEACYANRMTAVQWRMQKKLSGGGPLVDLGIYAFHGACMAAGANPVAVTSKYRPKTRPEFFQTTEEALDWTMEFPGGAKATCWSSYAEGGNRIRCENADASHWLEFGPAFNYNGTRANTSNGPLTFPPMRQQTAQMDAIARSFLDNTDIEINGLMGRRDMVIMEGIYKSAELDGKRVELDFTVPA